MFSKKESHMKKGLILFFSLLQILSIFGCRESMANQKRPEVTFYGEQSGLNTNFYMIFDLDNNGRLSDKNIETVVLNSPSKSVNPRIGFNSGDFIVSTDDKEAVVYGNYYFAEVISDNVKRIITVFRRKGIGEKAFGVPAGEGKIFFVNSDKKNIPIGECQYQEISTLDGEKRTVRVSRLLNPLSKWLFALGDKIFAIEKNGQLTQEGWVGWRKIATPEGKQLMILMTKGMNTNAKWAGRYDGKLYQDK